IELRIYLIIILIFNKEKALSAQLQRRSGRHLFPLPILLALFPAQWPLRRWRTTCCPCATRPSGPMGTAAP
ncbi:MAG: hypothetical protein ACREYA_35385, partial [Cupriavidus necator]